jgi:hypothetical protein
MLLGVYCENIHIFSLYKRPQTVNATGRLSRLHDIPVKLSSVVMGHGPWPSKYLSVISVYNKVSNSIRCEARHVMLKDWKKVYDTSLDLDFTKIM